MKPNYQDGEPEKHVTKTGLVYYAGKLKPYAMDLAAPNPDTLKLLGEQLFDRCEELGIELSMRDSMAIREGMVLIQFSADGPQYQIIPSWITTDGLAKEIVRRQKARQKQ